MPRNYPPNRYANMAILLSFASLVLLLIIVFNIQYLAIAYGIGSGAAIQSTADHANVTSILSATAAGVNALYNSILADYVVLIVSLGMLISSVLLYRYRANIFGAEAKGYVTLHGMLTIIYFLLFTINNANSLISLGTYYIVVVYAALLLSASIDIYVVFARYVFPARALTVRTDFALDPSRPYTNLIRIKDNIFSQLSGKVCVVDKHMNSVGIENFYRLIQDNLKGVTEINILTSGDMLDMEFSRNYLDCKNDIENAGAKIEVRVMRDEDSAVQHERFVFDDKSAYKVPPFNIIHKKSEHITRIKLSDAKKRFGELYEKATKYENFVSKNGKTKKG
ncbi:MAG: hypothetical protein KGH72_01755 [Candidatus Micrarchaeota archaeon]|nr:hypothetical protein [Candidatus Micrarchaeota archaeon]